MELDRKAITGLIATVYAAIQDAGELMIHIPKTSPQMIEGCRALLAVPTSTPTNRLKTAQVMKIRRCICVNTAGAVVRK